MYPHLQKLFSRILLVLLFSGYGAAAVNKDHVVRHFTDMDGLPQNSVNGIVTDKLHYLWLATQDGLVRFDGSRFIVYNKLSIAGLGSNRFSHFRSDSRGQIYAVNDLLQYVNINQKVPFLDTEAGLRMYRVMNRIGLKKGRSFWLRSFVDNWHGEPYEREYVYSLKSIFVRCTDSSVTYVDSNNQVKKQFRYAARKLSRFFTFGEEVYYLDSTGHLICFEGRVPQVCSIEGDILKNPAFSKNPSGVVVYWNSISVFTIIYCDHSFYLLRRNSHGRLDTKLLFTDTDIEQKEITSVHYDPLHNRLYIGSSIRGLYFITPKRFSVLMSAAEQNVFYAHTWYRQRFVLTGDGLILDPATGRTCHAPQLNGNSDRYGIFTDRLGNIWKKEYSRILHLDSDLNILQQWATAGHISNLYAGTDSFIWYCSGNVLYRIPVSAKAATIPERVLVLPSPACYMQQSADGTRMWVGTSEGLICVTLKTGKLFRVPELDGKYIRSLYLRNDDELWITTYEDGIFYFSGTQLVHMPMDRDNYLKAAHCIVEDKYGFFWISTNKGLFQASREDLLRFARGEQSIVYYHYYDQTDGLLTNEFNGGCQPCGLLMADGTISMPSLNGLVSFDPAHLYHEFPEAPVLMDQFFIDQVAYTATADRIYLPQKFGQLKIRLSAAYYGNVHNVRMQYAMSHNGITSQWYTLDGNNEITITDLASGNYTILVRKANGFGKNNFSELTIYLSVPPAFYETWWFFVLLALTLGLCIYFYIRLRLRYVVARNKDLELQVTKRTRYLDNALQKLTLSELKLKQQARMQEQIVAAIGHDIRSPLKFVVLANQKIHEDLLQQNTERALLISKEAWLAANKTYHHINNFVEFVRNQMQQGQVQLKPVYLREVVSGKLDFFEAVARDKMIRINNTVGEEIQVQSDAQLLSVIVHNLLDNAIKYARKGSIQVFVLQSAQDIHLVIADEGEGMNEQVAEWLNSTPGKNTAPAQNPSRGLGLIMVKELSEVLQIRIQVVIRSGTQFHLIFRMPGTA